MQQKESAFGEAEMEFRELIIDSIEDLYLLLDSVQYASVTVGEAFPQSRELTLLLSRTLGNAPKATYSKQSTQHFTDITDPAEVYAAIVHLKEQAERIQEELIAPAEAERTLCNSIISMANTATVLTQKLRL